MRRIGIFCYNRRRFGGKAQDLIDSVTRATYNVTGADLARMVLDKDRLPEELASFEPLREGILDNETIASHGFPGNTAEGFREIGRISGHMREFASTEATPDSPDGTDLLAATVVHLFDNEAAVTRWMREIFVRQFEENVGRTLENNLELLAVDRLEVDGFHDVSVGIRAVQRGPEGALSSTVIDFRVGRVLGVAFVVSVGDCERKTLSQRLGVEVERQIVRVALELR